MALEVRTCRRHVPSAAAIFELQLAENAVAKVIGLGLVDIQIGSNSDWFKCCSNDWVRSETNKSIACIFEVQIGLAQKSLKVCIFE